MAAVGERHYDSVREKMVTSKDHSFHQSGDILRRWMLSRHGGHLIYILKCQVLNTLHLLLRSSAGVFNMSHMLLKAVFSYVQKKRHPIVFLRSMCNREPLGCSSSSEHEGNIWNIWVCAVTLDNLPSWETCTTGSTLTWTCRLHRSSVFSSILLKRDGSGSTLSSCKPHWTCWNQAASTQQKCAGFFIPAGCVYLSYFCLKRLFILFMLISFHRQ